MSKKCIKDAFEIFKIEFEKKHEMKVFKKGITNMEVAARDSWRSMTLQQRDPYVDLAKQAAPIQNNTPKVDDPIQSQRLADAKNNKIVKEIVRQSVQSNTVRTNEYYFIAANIFCETSQNECIPAEIAILKFTLQHGIERTYHTLINPGKLPVGYNFTAIELSETTHQLPLPPNAKGQTDYAAIQQQITKFIGNAQTTKQGFIPLFTLAVNVPMIESICEVLVESDPNYHRYKVLPIDQLLFNLKARTERKSGQEVTQFGSIDDATSELNREKYKFLSAIACEFHEEMDCSAYCCLSDVKRWAYVLSEHICFDLKISLVQGKHFPMGVETPSVPVKLVQHNDSSNKENIAVALQHCIQTINLNANFDFQEPDPWPNVTSNITAKGYRRNYFVEESYPMRSYGKGRGRGRGSGRGRGFRRD